MPLLRVISLGRFLILMLSVSEPSVSLRAAVIGNSTQLLANAIDVDGDDLSVVNLSVVSSDVDNVTLTDNNNGTWTLTPKANFSGEITFNYQISDGYELTDAKLNFYIKMT
jgi:hypothetical protein